MNIGLPSNMYSTIVRHHHRRNKPSYTMNIGYSAFMINFMQNGDADILVLLFFRTAPLVNPSTSHYLQQGLPLNF
jgi:hypothetical protein